MAVVGLFAAPPPFPEAQTTPRGLGVNLGGMDCQWCRGFELTVSSRDLSSKISGKERDIAVEKLDVYKEWFLDVVMQRGKRDTLVLIPIENISPRYRDDPPL